MEQTVLSAKGLTMRYHNTLALDALDLDLPRGKIIGLLGPNGSGKTTFIKLAAGLLTPGAGEIRIGGEAVGVETKKLVSYLPDRPYFSKQRKISMPTRLIVIAGGLCMMIASDLTSIVGLVVLVAVALFEKKKSAKLAA